MFCSVGVYPPQITNCKRLFQASLTIIIFLIFSPSVILASGLAVQPATFLFRDIPVGQKIKLPAPLSIHNKDERTNTYKVKALSPSRIGMSWPEGYIESLDEHLLPKSLYLEQLEERSGKNAVKNIKNDKLQKISDR